MRRNLALLVPAALACWLVAPADAVADDAPSAAAPAADSLRAAYAPPTARDRFRNWALDAFGPAALAGSAMSASWGQWVTDEPPEWGASSEGFAKRFGTGVVTTAITETSVALVSAAMGHDTGYYRSPDAGTWPRIGHALRMTVCARDRAGRLAFSPARLGGPFAGPLVTRTTLFPDRYDALDGLESGAYGLLLNAGWNLAWEFVLPGRRW